MFRSLLHLQLSNRRNHTLLARLQLFLVALLAVTILSSLCYGLEWADLEIQVTIVPDKSIPIKTKKVNKKSLPTKRTVAVWVKSHDDNKAVPIHPNYLKEITKPVIVTVGKDRSISPSFIYLMTNQALIFKNDHKIAFGLNVNAAKNPPSGGIVASQVLEYKKVFSHPEIHPCTLILVPENVKNERGELLIRDNPYGSFAKEGEWIKLHNVPIGKLKIGVFLEHWDPFAIQKNKEVQNIRRRNFEYTLKKSSKTEPAQLKITILSKTG